MKVVGKPKLESFVQAHADVRGPASAWLLEVEEAEWSTPQDIKDRYPHASLITGERVVFNLKGKKYRVDVKVSYSNSIVLIKRLGTHAEYNRWKF